MTGGVLQPAEQPCVALSLPLEMTLSVRHSYIQALLTYGDDGHIHKTDIVLSGMVHVAFSSQRIKRLFLWCFIFIGENVLSLANRVCMSRSPVNN